MKTASIVVHKTPPEQLKTAIECLKRSNVNHIYIIDNGPDQPLKNIVNSDSLTYLRVENKGYGAGHNIAIKEAIKRGAVYHLVLNADVWWKGDILSPIQKYMDNNPEIGLISPKTFYPDGEIQYTCRMLPTPSDMFLRGFLPEKWGEKRNKNYLLKTHDHNQPLNCPYLLGSFMFFRVEALKDCGLFDERFFMYPEDIDMTRRIHRKWKTLYWPEVTIVHEHQRASKKSFKMFRIHFFNMVKYFNKWGWFFDKERKIFNENLLSNKSL